MPRIGWFQTPNIFKNESTQHFKMGGLAEEGHITNI